jgi:hypothetical protein
MFTRLRLRLSIGVANKQSEGQKQYSIQQLFDHGAPPISNCPSHRDLFAHRDLLKRPHAIRSIRLCERSPAPTRFPETLRHGKVGASVPASNTVVLGNRQIHEKRSFIMFADWVEVSAGKFVERRAVEASRSAADCRQHGECKCPRCLAFV